MREILKDRSIVEVSGEGALPFLQNLTTNDLIKNDYCYTYMLSNQGRYWFDFFVFKQNEETLLIDIASSRAREFILKLNLYKLRAKVTIQDASARYDALYSVNATLESLMSFQDPRFKKLGYRSITNKEACSATQEALYLNDKYKYAIPDGEPDLLFDRSVPVEFGAEELSAISYSKGCYIGQEVISRVKYQGEVRKKIFKIYSEQSLENITKYTEIVAEDMQIGVICSGYKNLAIGLLREEKYLALNKKEARVNDIKVIISAPEWREKEL